MRGHFIVLYFGGFIFNFQFLFCETRHYHHRPNYHKSSSTPVLMQCDSLFIIFSQYGDRLLLLDLQVLERLNNRSSFNHGLKHNAYRRIYLLCSNHGSNLFGTVVSRRASLPVSLPVLALIIAQRDIIIIIVIFV